MNAMRKAQEAAQLAADYWLVYEGATGVKGDKERAQEAEHSMFKWATLAQAEAAERQAAALEGIYAMLRYIAPAIEYQAAGDVSPEFKAGAAVDAVRADDVDSDPYGDGYNGPRAGHDQRREDDQGYSAGIAPGLHR